VKNKIFEDGNRAIFETDNEDELLLKFTDDLVDDRENVKGTVKNKGAISAQVAVHLYKVLSSYHLPVRFRSQKSAKELIIKPATLFPFYSILTNVEDDDGKLTPQIDFVLMEEKGEKNVEMKELLNAEVVSPEQMTEIRRFILKMNVIITDFFQRRDLSLLGFQAQFGILPNGKIGLCSELTLDTCEVKDANSRTKYTTAYIISHLDDADELYDKAIGVILY